MPGHLVIVPTAALKDPRLSHAEFKTLCHISTFASTENGWCWFLMSTLASELNISIRAAQKHIKRLIELGYIVREAQFKGGQQRANRYQVVLNTALKKGGEPQVHTERSFLNDKKEKKALTRDEFLREIDRGFKAGAFAEWEHLTESEIYAAAEACLDFYGAKGEWPAGEPVPVLRHWIRGGVKNGTLRAKPKEPIARRGSEKVSGPEIELQPWHERIRSQVGDAEFAAWFQSMTLEGDRLIAPSKFHADFVKQRFGAEIARVIPNAAITTNPAREKQLCTA